VNEFLNRGISPSKIVLGLATYGRAFTHSAAFGSNPPLGTAADAGRGGQYTNQDGILAYYEVRTTLRDPALIRDQGSFETGALSRPALIRDCRSFEAGAHLRPALI
jgi:GH18 family chitinase